MGQSKAQVKKAEKLFKNRTEIHFWFLLKKRTDISELTRRISIDHVHGDTVWAFANKRGLLGFFELGYSRFILLPTSAELFLQQEKKEKSRKKFRQTAAFDTYLTYPQYEQAMQAFADQYPSICQLATLGILPSGRKILALKITDSLNKREFEPRFFYTSSMHGDETTGFPLMLKLADTLLKSYGQNGRLTQMVNEMEIWINPLANPDGTYRGGNQSVSSATRFNANNVDLNRNYPDPQDGTHPDGNPFQPETNIFMSFGDTMDFVMSANFHGGAEVANFPWDTWQRRHADEVWWTAESKKFADSARVQAPANFFNQLFGYPNIPGVVQGFDWYEVNGGRQDYMNWFNNCRELTVELSNTKLIPPAQINNHWKYFAPSLLNFMDAARFGLKGVVTDACSGKPIRARVFVLNHDKDSSHVYSSRNGGMYFRPIAPGSYSFQVSAPGYQPLVLNNVTISVGQVLRQDVALQPLAPLAQFSVSRTEICSSTVQFQDLSGSGSQWIWDFGDGQSSTVQNPEHNYSGEGPFTVRLSVSNCAGSQLVEKADLIRNYASQTPVLQGDTSFCGARAHVLQSLNGGNVEWFSQAIGGNRLDSGSILTTLPLPTSQIYYAQSVKVLPKENVGPASNIIGSGGYFTANAYHYLLFDCYKACRLHSVKVFANTSGNRTIQLRNANGQVLASRVVNIPMGESRVILQLDIPVGESLQLGISGGTSNNLFRNNTGAAYPYILDGRISINGNSAGNPAIYYFFYDWEIGSRCESARIPVSAVVLIAPQPAVQIQAQSLTICQGDTARFTATFSQAGSTPEITWLVNGLPQSMGQSFESHLLPNNAQIKARIFSQDTCAVFNPATSSALIITVNTRPDPPTVSFQNGWLVSSLAQGNHWYLNGNLISSPLDDSLFVNQNGTYWARVSNQFGCFSLSSQSVLVNDISAAKTWLPGLVHQEEDRLIITWAGLFPAEYQLMDMQGKLVQSGQFSAGENQLILQNFAPGVYYLQCGLQRWKIHHPSLLTR